MIGLDTNVFIRYFVQDDEQQAKLATDLIENQCSRENMIMKMAMRTFQIILLRELTKNSAVPVRFPLIKKPVKTTALNY